MSSHDTASTAYTGRHRAYGPSTAQRVAAAAARAQAEVDRMRVVFLSVFGDLLTPAPAVPRRQVAYRDAELVAEVGAVADA